MKLEAPFSFVVFLRMLHYWLWGMPVRGWTVTRNLKPHTSCKCSFSGSVFDYVFISLCLYMCPGWKQWPGISTEITHGCISLLPMLNCDGQYSTVWMSLVDSQERVDEMGRSSKKDQGCGHKQLTNRNSIMHMHCTAMACMGSQSMSETDKTVAALKSAMKC